MKLYHGQIQKSKIFKYCIKSSHKFNTIELLKYVKKLRKNLEKKNNKNSPRECDIDIIDYNNKNKKKLILPHPRMHKRNFVLFPYLR